MNASPKSIVLGTAGHIDHGKTALLKSLTGVDADRLKEEKERGITIDIGFAPWVDPPYRIGFIDVPGHEKFVKNMLAGAAASPASCWWSRPTKAVMPQTREHFEIIHCSGSPIGVIALTKCDLVADEYQELAEDDVRRLVRGSFLEAAPVIRTSAVTGQGLAELRAALRGLADRMAEPSADGNPRLFIDRVFVIRGFGAVVTGTVLSGVFRRNDRVAILPEGREAKIRHLEVYEQEAAEARAGQRAALNLAGLEPADLRRGRPSRRPTLHPHPDALRPLPPAGVVRPRHQGRDSGSRLPRQRRSCWGGCSCWTSHAWSRARAPLSRSGWRRRPWSGRVTISSCASIPRSGPWAAAACWRFTPPVTARGTGSACRSRLARLEGATDAVRIREAVGARADNGVTVAELVNLTGLPASRVAAVLAESPPASCCP